MALLALTAGAVAVGLLVAGAPEDPARRADAPDPTASAPAKVELDVSRLPIPREPFCADLDDPEVPLALAAPVDDGSSWESGDTVLLAPGLRDVAHEFGCRFVGADAEARVWVFAAPVSVAEARRLVREARSADGCRVLRSGTAYGRPGLTRACSDGGEVEVSARGLFGDTWLTCQLTDGADRGEVTRRAERWCVHVATTLGAR